MDLLLLGAIQIGVVIALESSWKMSDRFKPQIGHSQRFWQMDPLSHGAIQSMVETVSKSEISSEMSKGFRQQSLHLLRFWQRALLLHGEMRATAETAPKLQIKLPICSSHSSLPFLRTENASRTWGKNHSLAAFFHNCNDVRARPSKHLQSVSRHKESIGYCDRSIISTSICIVRQIRVAPSHKSMIATKRGTLYLGWPVMNLDWCLNLRSACRSSSFPAVEPCWAPGCSSSLIHSVINSRLELFSSSWIESYWIWLVLENT